MKAWASRRGAPGSAGRERDVFRSPGAVIMWWTWLLVAAIILIDVAVQGRGHAAAATALLVLAVTGVAYATAWWPRVVADADGITVANPLREHHVPWMAVDRVELANALRIHCVPGPPGPAAAPGSPDAPGSRPPHPRGVMISSWAVQSSARSAMKREMAARRDQRRVSRAGFGRWPGPDPGRPRGAAAADEAMLRSPAGYAAERLDERARLARQAAAGGPAAAAPAPASSGAATPDSVGGQPTARWAWAPIAAMVAPTVAFIVVLLTLG